MSQTAALRRRLLALPALALGTIVADQASKAWVRSALPLDGTRPVVPGWVHLNHVLNEGAAWGMLNGQRALLIMVTVVVIGSVSMVAGEIARRGVLPTMGLGLILGGAVGNLIDRIAHAAVTDFIDLDTPVRWLQTFPVFNVADSALTVGVTLLIVDLLWHGRWHSSATPVGETPAIETS